MQQSNIGLTSVLYSINISSSDLLIIFLLIKPIILLADLLALLQFTDCLKLSVNITPRAFSSFVSDNPCPINTYFDLLFPLPICITLHLPTLNGMQFPFDHKLNAQC